LAAGNCGTGGGVDSGSRLSGASGHLAIVRPGYRFVQL